MNTAKKGVQAQFVVTMVALARIHKFYLQGFSWSVESPYEIQKANEFLGECEKILIASGYMTQAEINARREAFMPKTSATTPADAVL